MTFKKAEGVGFEPTSPEKGHGSPGRPVGPLRHPSTLNRGHQGSPSIALRSPLHYCFGDSLRSHPLLEGRILLLIILAPLSIGGDTQSFSPSMALRHYAKHNCLRCHPPFPLNSSLLFSLNIRSPKFIHSGTLPRSASWRYRASARPL